MSLADPTSLEAGFIREDGVGPFAINDATGLAPVDRSWKAMVATMRADADSFKNHWHEPVVRRFYPGLFIIWSHRLAHTLHIRGVRSLAIVVMWFCHALTGAELRPGARIGPGLLIIHPSTTVVGGGSVIGSNVMLLGGNLLGANKALGIHGSPRLGDEVVLGAHAMAIGPVLIGDGAKVGAGSLVLEDVAPGATVKGSPAR